MPAMGMFAAWTASPDAASDPERWIGEGFDRSGIMAVPLELSDASRRRPASIRSGRSRVRRAACGSCPSTPIPASGRCLATRSLRKAECKAVAPTAVPSLPSRKPLRNSRTVILCKSAICRGTRWREISWAWPRRASTKLGRNERVVAEVKWCRFEKLVQKLEPDAVGRPPFDPLLVFKALLLLQWYAL